MTGYSFSAHFEGAYTAHELTGTRTINLSASHCGLNPTDGDWSVLDEEIGSDAIVVGRLKGCTARG